MCIDPSAIEEEERQQQGVYVDEIPYYDTFSIFC